MSKVVTQSCMRKYLSEFFARSWLLAIASLSRENRCRLGRQCRYVLPVHTWTIAGEAGLRLNFIANWYGRSSPGEQPGFKCDPSRLLMADRPLTILEPVWSVGSWRGDGLARETLANEPTP